MKKESWEVQILVPFRPLHSWPTTAWSGCECQVVSFGKFRKRGIQLSTRLLEKHTGSLTVGRPFNSRQHYGLSLTSEKVQMYCHIFTRRKHHSQVELKDTETFLKQWSWCFNLLDTAVEVIVRWWALTPMIHLEFHCCIQPAVWMITSSLFGVNPPILEKCLFTSSFYFPLRSFFLVYSVG